MQFYRRARAAFNSGTRTYYLLPIGSRVGSPHVYSLTVLRLLPIGIPVVRYDITPKPLSLVAYTCSARQFAPNLSTCESEKNATPFLHPYHRKD